jgi:hypothetical protein
MGKNLLIWCVTFSSEHIKKTGAVRSALSDDWFIERPSVRRVHQLLRDLPP